MKTDTEVETDNAEIDLITPTFSGLETESIFESVSLSKFASGISSNKNEFSLSELASSVKIDCGSTAWGPHLNGGDLRRVYRLQRYARLHFCFVNDTEDLIT